MADTRDPLTPEDLLQHAGWIRNLARKLLQDEAAAEDVVQQTWTAAIERRPSARTELRGWLWVVARNFALRRRRQDRVLRRVQDAESLSATMTGPADAVERGESARLILDAVLRLPEPSRQLLLLRYFENQPPREIARITGMTGDAVRSQLKRARARLRSQLRGQYGVDWTALCLPLAGPPAWLSAPFLVSMMSKPIRLVAATVLLLAVLVPFLDLTGGGDTAPDDGPVAAAAAAEMESGEVVRVERAADASGPGFESRTSLEESVLLLQLVDGDGAPVPDARVRFFAAMPWNDPGAKRGFDPSQYASSFGEARSDAEGRIRFPRPRLEGGLAVVAEAGGASLGHEVFLNAPPPTEDWDLGLLSLAPGRRMVLHVTDVFGNPVAGARVAVFGYSDPRAFWSQHGVTDALGEAEFPFTPLQADGVEATAASFLRENRALESALDGLDPVVVELVLERGAGFKVTVVDSNGAPVDGAEVYAHEIELPANTRTDQVYGRGLCEPNYRGRTAADGSLAVTGLLEQSRRRGCWVAARKDGAVAALHPVALEEEVRLVLPVSIKVRGVLLDPSGALAAGAELAIFEPGQAVWPPAFEGKTDASGRFAFRLPAGQYLAYALHERGWLKTETPLELGQDQGELELWLKPGCALDLEVVTTGGAPASSARLSHRYPGFLANSPTPEATELAWDGVTYRYFAGRRPDRAGHLRIGCLPPGPLQLKLGGPAFEWQSIELDAPESGSLEMKVELQLRESELPQVRVQVRDSHNEPVARADLRFRSPSGELQGDGILPETTHRGEYVFQPTELGLWQVTAEKDGRRSPVSTFEVDRDLAEVIPSLIQLQIPPLAELRIRAFRGTEPVPDCEVGSGRSPVVRSGRREPLNIEDRAVTDRAGEAVFSGLPVGPRGLRLEAPSAFPVELSADLAPGSNTIDVQLGGVPVSGSLAGAGGEGQVYLCRIVTEHKPERLIRSMVRWAEEWDHLDLGDRIAGQVGTMAPCDQDGFFRFRMVPEGDYLLLATAPGRRISPPQWIAVGGAAVSDIQIPLELAGSARVQITRVSEARKSGQVDVLTLELQRGEDRRWPSFDEPNGGEIFLPKLAPGVWAFRLNGKDLEGNWRVLDEVTVEVVAGQAAEVTLRASS